MSTRSGKRAFCHNVFVNRFSECKRAVNVNKLIPDGLHDRQGIGAKCINWFPLFLGIARLISTEHNVMVVEADPQREAFVLGGFNGELLPR